MDLKDISRIGLGGCEIPNDQEKANKLISFAIDNGINFFDEGWGYGGERRGEDHRSEIVLGNYIKNNPEIRKKIILCDKLPVNADLPDDADLHKVFDEWFSEQLKVLNTDYLDIYMLHALDDNKNVPESRYLEAIRWMIQKKAEGKIKHIGFSAHIDFYKLNYYIDLFEENFGNGIVDTAMLTYNIFSGSDWIKEQTGIFVWPNPGPRGLELCKKHGITVISMMPLESGRVFEISHDKTFTEWCYRFVLDNKNIASTLTGTSNINHLKQIIDVCNTKEKILLKKEEKTPISKKLTKKKESK